ncbi:hypothetical protein BLOT_014343 [Blomia tropicalis]|nr:hypothetical protein BLOT_014343 [Blomia tropicalis]
MALTLSTVHIFYSSHHHQHVLVDLHLDSVHDNSLDILEQAAEQGAEEEQVEHEQAEAEEQAEEERVETSYATN